MAESPQETERRASPSEAAGEAQRRLASMLEAVDPSRPVAIYTHDHPDPDSIASAYAMQHLLNRRLEIEPIIAYGGRIGRATNHAMVDQLGVRLYPLGQVRTSDFGTNILIDTQPETGNHSIPADLPIAIAVDHHPVRPETSRVEFADIRTEYGATSTIMYYYLKAAGLDLPTRLATALLFGIKSDTRGLERETSEADLHAYLEIFPHADLTMLTRIENPIIPRSHFEVFHKALEESEIVGEAVVTDIGRVDNADVVAELADFLIPLEHVDYALVMGRHRDRLYLSLRTRDEGHDAGRLISTVVGDLGTAGGHGKMAGGQIELGPAGSDPAGEVVRRFKAALGMDDQTAGQPLIRDGKG